MEISRHFHACAVHKAKQRPVAKHTTLQSSQPGKRIYTDTAGPFPSSLVGHLRSRINTEE
jgi:hypothetical protein